jgi:hypothetical protein
MASDLTLAQQLEAVLLGPRLLGPRKSCVPVTGAMAGAAMPQCGGFSFEALRGIEDALTLVA